MHKESSFLICPVELIIGWKRDSAASTLLSKSFEDLRRRTKGVIQQ